MNELIKVTTNENNEQLVSGRELHEFLGITERYSSWFDRMLKYGFIENVDFVGCKLFNTLARQELQDHSMKLDMAKEISMLQRSDKGKQARHYFLQVEKAWNDPDMVVQRAMQIQQKKIEVLQLENESMKPKALFADAVRGSTNSCLVKDLALVLKQNGINIGQNRLFAYLRRHKFLGSGRGHYNKPTQKSMDRGLFEYRENFHTNSFGEVETKFTPLVTGKGQEYFINKFLKYELIREA
ncbi:phage antirepressor KilAC domain-containing protein [Enterococcus hulanensis]|uniref:phage antirepressor KilAC domain-containing protein n=1 Tax=Enterococcus hulanensis TaxID=2559929 RepID=UPI0028903238|nr:phage antirepressor KilAC domain-containing protein [Enterococcus hulanensis]MDT2661063.1 phage antirepressor KilAC domain-containing protein [Enterococcus hulanensis]